MKHTPLKAKLIDHFNSSMPIPVDRDYAEHLLDSVIADARTEGIKNATITIDGVKFICEDIELTEEK